MCDKIAEWEVIDTNLYDVTYSCTDHLSAMVSDETQVINAYSGNEVCCHLNSAEGYAAGVGFRDAWKQVAHRYKSLDRFNRKELARFKKGIRRFFKSHVQDLDEEWELFDIFPESLHRFLEQAWDAAHAVGVEEERERCAGIAESADNSELISGSTFWRHTGYEMAKADIAAAIRAGEVQK